MRRQKLAPELAEEVIPKHHHDRPTASAKPRSRAVWQKLATLRF